MSSSDVDPTFGCPVVTLTPLMFHFGPVALVSSSDIDPTFVCPVVMLTPLFKCRDIDPTFVSLSTQ